MRFLTYLVFVHFLPPVVFTGNANELDGTLPTEFGNLAKLEICWLYTNLFTGTIPSQIGNMASLGKINL
jgi:hypothetical protein